MVLNSLWKEGRLGYKQFGFAFPMEGKKAGIYFDFNSLWKEGRLGYTLIFEFPMEGRKVGM